MTKITLPSGRKIGPGQPPFIIAEVGSNWSTFEDCKSSIALARQCGADAVKFQAFDEKALYGREGLENCVVSALQKLPLDWLPKLADKARACGIEFMCSAFSPDLVEAVDPYVNVHKVASAELTHVRILQKLRKLGKPVILSTGASGEADIRQALEVLGPTPTILMYCVAAYPARSVYLETLTVMREKFGVPVGYSDHTTDVAFIPVTAVLAGGACVLEKHVNFVGATSPDAPHSLSTDEFQTMVRRIREGRDLGKCWIEMHPDFRDRLLSPSPEETPMILRHNRRLIATRDILEGETLAEGVNFGIYRSLKDDTRAASPWLIDQMNGKPVKRALQAGDGIAPGDV